MEPDKEQNKENNYDVKTTVNALHDSGIDVVEGSPVQQENEFSVGETPKPDVTEPAQFSNQVRPSAQTMIDGMLGIKNKEDSKNDPSVRPLRTFKTDAEEAIKYNNVSRINIAVAEQKRRETVANFGPGGYSGEKKSLNFTAIIILLAVVLGIGGGGYYYWSSLSQQTSSAAKIPKGLSVKTLIAYNKVDTITIETGKDPLSLIGDKLSSTEVNIGEVYALIPISPGTTTAMASPSSIFTETHIPGALSRSISGDYMIGSYFLKTNSPFIILKNTFFQNAFAGMLEWENNMRNDLMPLIRVSYKDEKLIDTNTDIFTDAVVSNTDARILKDSDEKVILVYAFADKDTIVITTNTDTLKYILDILLSVRVVQ